jgi:cholinesterase
VGDNNNEAGLFNAAAGGQLPPAAQAQLNLQFNCPVANAALVRRSNKVEAYRYRYFGIWPNLEISPDAGAYHSAEVPMIFGNAALITGIADTPAQSGLGKLMRTAWASFAKDPELGLSRLGWPIYNVKGR